MRRKREEWPKLVARWEASGESAAVFAGRVGTKAVTLYRWRRVLRAAATSGPTLAKIVEVRPARLAAVDRFEVRLSSALGGHPKSGQLWSPQKRPVGELGTGFPTVIASGITSKAAI